MIEASKIELPLSLKHRELLEKAVAMGFGELGTQCRHPPAISIGNRLAHHSRLLAMVVSDRRCSRRSRCICLDSLT